MPPLQTAKYMKYKRFERFISAVDCNVLRSFAEGEHVRGGGGGSEPGKGMTASPGLRR
jgi:hypothetical protein